MAALATLLEAPVLSVQGLTVAFGEAVAVADLSFDIHAGETLALVGESGSGKSVTALSVLRLIEREGGRIAGGSIQLQGTEVTTLAPRALRQMRGGTVSMVFQEPMTSLNPVMRIGAQVAEVLVLHQHLDRRSAVAAAERALEEVRIPEPRRRLSQFPHELSGGMRQRVMIAMALACRPSLLIADEPTTALDVTTQAELLALIKALQAERGMAILFITHDMGVVAAIADRALVLRKGRMVEEAHVAALFARPRAAYTRQLLAAAPRLDTGGREPVGRADVVLDIAHLTTTFAARTGPFRPRQVTTAVDDVSFALHRGETLGLVGESGCGKSTLARSILRLIEPASGRITLGGTRIDGLDDAAMRPHRRRIQMVFQDPYASLNPRMNVGDAVTEPAYLHGLVSGSARNALALEMLGKVGLEPDAARFHPHQFSGGQRQRLCIARALSVSPDVIVADEAVSALDVSIALQITDLLLAIQSDAEIAILFISHDIAVVERVSHRIAVMQQGRIVEIGEAAQILRQPRDDYTRRLIEAVPRLPAQPDMSVKEGVLDPAM